MTSKRTPSKADNFKLITGISRSVERRLHEAGITTYAKMASLTPQGISTILGDVNGVTTKRIIKENWVERARDLSSRPALAESKEEEVGGEGLLSLESQGLTSFIVELLRDEEGRTKRTKVMHVETGQEDAWTGWQGRRLLDFFVTRAGLYPAVMPAEQMTEAKIMSEAIPAPATTPGAAPSPEAPREARPQAIEIVTRTGGAIFKEAEQIPLQARGVSGNLVAHQPFKVHLALDLSEIDSSHRKPLNYRASIYAKSLKGPLRQSVGEADGQLEPTDAVTLIINGNPLPQGLYRLQAAVDLSDPTSPAKHRISPILQTGEKLLRVA